MTLDLKSPCTISSMKLLLWNLDNRYHRYKIEASLDTSTWTTIVDRTAVTNQCRGWQEVGFNPAVQARYLRLTGTYNSANTAFCVVEWEVYGVLLMPDNSDQYECGLGAGRRYDELPGQARHSSGQPQDGDGEPGQRRRRYQRAVRWLLVFNTTTWSNNQTVTLQAAEDADTVNSSASHPVQPAGVTHKDVTATEQDNDGVVVNLALARGARLRGATGASGAS